MPIHVYICGECSKSDRFFSNEDKICSSCQSTQLKKQMSVPLDNKITECTDKYHNINAPKGIESDLKSRTARHVNDTMQETIEQFKADYGEIEGTKMAKELGFLRWDKKTKEWRVRSDQDTNTVNKSNKASSRVHGKVVK